MRFRSLTVCKGLCVFGCVPYKELCAVHARHHDNGLRRDIVARFGNCDPVDAAESCSAGAERRVNVLNDDSRFADIEVCVGAGLLLDAQLCEQRSGQKQEQNGHNDKNQTIRRQMTEKG